MKTKTKILLIITGLIIAFVLIIIISRTETSVHKEIEKHTTRIYESLVDIRRDFHRHPELSGQEKKTSAKIERYLDSLGLKVHTGIGGYGVVGILNEEKEGPKIAWRADIDAFKTSAPDVVSFNSQNPGVRHICGHDVHTTIALGIADVLAKIKDKLDGTVYFIFQPSEENFQGAKAMIDDGLFKLIQPDEIYALHITPLPVGTFTAKEKEVFSYVRGLEIKFNGVNNNDTIVPFIRGILNKFNTVDPVFWDYESIFGEEKGISSPKTLYKNYLAVRFPFYKEKSKDNIEMLINLHASKKGYFDSLPEKIREEIHQTEFAGNLESIEYSIKYPTVINDAMLSQQTMQSVISVYGKESFLPSYGVINGFNDDFSYLQENIPGVYYLLGGSNREKGIRAMPHSPGFDVDEECIRYGVQYFSSMIYGRVGKAW